MGKSCHEPPYADPCQAQLNGCRTGPSGASKNENVALLLIRMLQKQVLTCTELVSQMPES